MGIGQPVYLAIAGRRGGVVSSTVVPVIDPLMTARPGAVLMTDDRAGRADATDAEAAAEASRAAKRANRPRAAEPAPPRRACRRRRTRPRERDASS